ncbi:N-6 DNA methylase [Kitasatospora sp. NBC_01287]|uniref:N-6 DNA methylase n=1 Tax=Kitasatospora sp. NBC_01287 TaxID=2903573 RepID=UPI00225AB339|nr:N-6 DNA methylase [Kitasatospora sp. NBC_01287]MCX4747101.1 N-6 DNA methylase [Kitasatospora sp. NBC_01287]
MPPSPEVTAVEIARLAGVGRAAVSNWRKRHADFPQPVGGSEASPAFALAQVEEWLRRQGKIAELPPLERCRRQLDALRDPAGHPGAPLLLAGAFLLLLHRAPERWTEPAGRPDTRLALALPRAVTEVLHAALGTALDEALGAGAGGGAGSAAGSGAGSGADPGAPGLPTLYGSTQLDLCRMLARLAEEQPPAAVYEALLAGTRQPNQLPPEAAALLLALAGEPASVLDPSCGLGPVLLAAPAGASRHGQDRDPVTAAAALLRLALHTPADTPGPLPLGVRAGDALRADGYPQLLADAVLCRPPFNERDWGHEELRYDPRWLFDQAPPRAEPELAWLLHCLAHTRPGGLTALLLPPTVASRRSGRRLRAELLRTGALRAVAALPAGAAPPYGVPLQLWLLRRPDPQEAAPARRLLLLDATATQPEQFDWPTLHRTVLEGWQAFDGGSVADRPGVYRVLDSIELLDDDTDLAPARHLPPPAPADGAAALGRLRGRLGELLGSLAELDRALPAVTEAGAAPAAPLTTVGELARQGALEVFSSGTGPATRALPDDPAAPPVLTDQDLLAGRPPSLALAAGEALRARPGDVLVPALAGGAALVVHPGDPADGAALGPRLHLLRPDPAALDPEFLAGRLRSTAAARTAGSHASTTSRLDVRRVQLPRLPLARQRELGEAFRQVAAFETGVRQAAELARRLAQGLTDGLAEGELGVE